MNVREFSDFQAAQRKVAAARALLAQRGMSPVTPTSAELSDTKKGPVHPASTPLRRKASILCRAATHHASRSLTPCPGRRYVKLWELDSGRLTPGKEYQVALQTYTSARPTTPRRSHPRTNRLCDEADRSSACCCLSRARQTGRGFRGEDWAKEPLFTRVDAEVLERPTFKLFLCAPPRVSFRGHLQRPDKHTNNKI